MSGKGYRASGGRERGNVEIAGRKTRATGQFDNRLRGFARMECIGLRSAFGVDAGSLDYQQTAVITTVLPQRFHDHVSVR